MPYKNSRAGKRSSSSSSFSAVTVVIIIAFCVLGVYMLSSSSLVPSRSSDAKAFGASTPTRFTKFISSDRPPSDEGGSDADLGSGESGGGKGGSGSTLIREFVEDTPEVRDGEERQNEEVQDDGGKGKEGDPVQDTSGEENLQEQEDQGKSDENELNLEKVKESERNQVDDKTDDGGTEQIVEQTETQSEGEHTSGETPVKDASDQNKEENRLPDENGEVKDEAEVQDESGGQGEETQSGKEDGKEETGSQDDGGENNEEAQGQNDGEGTEGGGTKEQTVVENEGGQNPEESQPESIVEKEEKEEEHRQELDNEKDGVESKPPDEERSPSEGNDAEEKKLDSVEEESPGATTAEISESKSAGENRRANGNEKQDGSNRLGLDRHRWELCNVTAGADYIPCLDNEVAIMKLHSRRHFEHRERHCPEEGPTCLVPLPRGYRQSIEWPKSRDKVWFHNVPHSKLAEVKGHQNWVKVEGEFLTFPGGGTQFIHGANYYIDFIRQAVPNIAWGKQTRVILDVGCGVASLGGYLFNKDVLTMSFAPKDEHEAQVQLALERGIPAISAVMGSQRLPFPGRVFDIVHCARCRVPWHAEGGTLLLELNRVLRPGGYFVWSATPVYQKLKEDVEIWNAMKSLTISMCWDLITIKKHKINGVAAAIYRKPTTNDCYYSRKRNQPPVCKEDDDPNAAWYVPLQSCMHKLPVDSSERGSQWPQQWPRRLRVPPYWLNNSQAGVYGKPAPADFLADYEHWKRIVSKSYLSGLGISWSNVRNVMDMRAVYGGFAAALNDLKLWVMNVVNVDAPDTLPIIFERGLFGIYHDWCESFSSYPRTYDLLHADQLFSKLKKRCNLIAVIAEVDRLVRPGGKLIVHDEASAVSEVETLLKSLHWEVRLAFFSGGQGLLSAEKTDWRPGPLSGSS